MDPRRSIISNHRRKDLLLLTFVIQFAIEFHEPLFIKSRTVPVLTQLKKYLSEISADEDLIFSVTEDLDELESKCSQTTQVPGEDDLSEQNDDIHDTIQQIKLPKPVKQTYSNKPWWDLNRNRLGETELQRMVIDMKLTDEPRTKVEAIDQLINDRQHPVNVWDNTGLTPLHEAANWGLPKIARILLKAGATVDALTNQNMEFEKEQSGEGSKEGPITPLQDAIETLMGEQPDVMLKKLETIQVILEYGPNVLRKNARNQTALQSFTYIREQIAVKTDMLTDDLKAKFDVVKRSLFELTQSQKDNPRLRTEAAKTTSFIHKIGFPPETSPQEALEVKHRRVAGITRLLKDDHEDSSSCSSEPPLKNFLKKCVRRGGPGSLTPERNSISSRPSSSPGRRKRKTSSPDSHLMRVSKRIQILSSDDEDSKCSLSSFSSKNRNSTLDQDIRNLSNPNGVKRRLTVSYLNEKYHRRKLRITISDSQTVQILRDKIVKEIIRKEERRHDQPNISIFVGLDDDESELTPSDLLADAIDFDRNEHETVKVKISSWTMGLSPDSVVEDYERRAKSGGFIPFEACVDLLKEAGKTKSISMASLSFPTNGPDHISAALSSFSGSCLVELNLSAQNLSPIIPQVTTALKTLPSLSRLLLSKCRLTRTHLSELSVPGMPKVRLLDLSSNITGDCGPELAKLSNSFPQLEDLKLSRMKLSHMTFEEYNLDFSKLVNLDISQNLKIGSLGIENLKVILRDSFSLQTLEAAQITQSEDILSSITKLFVNTAQDLKHLKLMKNNIQPDSLEDNADELSMFCELESINFSNNKDINSEAVQSLLTAIPSLQCVTLHGTNCRRSEFASSQIPRLDISN